MTEFGNWLPKATFDALPLQALAATRLRKGRGVPLLDHRECADVRPCSRRLSTGLCTIVVAAFVAFVPSAASFASDRYTLGPQDKVRVYVHEWPVLTGEFAVGASGELTVPMVGALSVTGLDVKEVASTLAERLRTMAGLAELPSAAVEVAQYRPFYVLGGVDKPGEYSYRPRMTVLTAVSIAGGLYRSRETSSWLVQRDAISWAGERETLVARRDALAAKIMRLKAEASSAQAVDFGDLSPSLFVTQEQSVFTERLRSFSNEHTALQNFIVLYQREIEALQAQITAEQRQAKSVRDELTETRGNISRGLVPGARAQPLERTLAQIEREQRELEATIVRAQQQIAVTQQKIAALVDQRRTTALTELQSATADHADTLKRIRTTEELVAGASAPAADLRETSDQLANVVFAIVRQQQDGSPLETVVPETTRVEPGDIIKVQLLPPRSPDEKARAASPRLSQNLPMGTAKDMR